MAIKVVKKVESQPPKVVKKIETQTPVVKKVTSVTDNVANKLVSVLTASNGTAPVVAKPLMPATNIVALPQTVAISNGTAAMTKVAPVIEPEATETETPEPETFEKETIADKHPNRKWWIIGGSAAATILLTVVLILVFRK